MRYRSTRSSDFVSASEAILRGLAPDGGLYMPERFPQVLEEIKALSPVTFSNLAKSIAQHFLEGDLSPQAISELCTDAFDFPVPLVEVSPGIHVLELFHGPTLAFKDFGARFMARCMGALTHQHERTVLLVATSGDTGGAVAHGFFNIPGIDVVVLYPSGKVTPLQEKQFTTLGGNVTALEVNGTFDDCQHLVKEIFADSDFGASVRLASANSINVARLIPQSFYYFWAASRLEWRKDITFITPSGNFGNLTAGIFAERMGLQVSKFVAATNSNDTVPEYLERGKFRPRPSIETLSNAMDVGNPSNFERLMDLFQNNRDALAQRLLAFRCADEETISMMAEIFKTNSYIADPHTAVGLFAAKQLRANGECGPLVVLGTAHPAKFIEIVERALGQRPAVPEVLAKHLAMQKLSIKVNPQAAAVKALIRSRYSNGQ